MNKKGSEHVDWIISMGIFLVALITIFLLLKPGIQKENNETFLLNILQDKFENDFFWSVKKVPLLLGVCEGYLDETDHTKEIDPLINLDVVNGWRLSQTQLFSKQNGKIIDHGVSKDPDWNGVTCVLGSNPKAPSGGGCANYNCVISKGMTSSDFVYYLTFRQGNPDVEFNLKDSTSNTCVPEHCVYRIGAVEDNYGLNVDGDFKEFLSESKAPGISVYKKNNIKDIWGFPKNKEFFVKSKELDLDYETANLEQGMNVYTKTFKTNIINQYGEIIPITIYFGVW